MQSLSRGPRRQRVVRTRNAGMWTEAEYFSRIRSAMRDAFMWWRPAQLALNATRVGSGKHARYRCSSCAGFFGRKQVHIDHKVPCGSLTCYEHLPEFVRRLTPEDPDAYQILCKGEGTRRCHEAKTNAEREAKAVGEG